MSDPLAEIRASFFVECEELLEGLQDALRELEDGTASEETINVAFRAVHSIKGGAGAFGLDDLVAFAHILETAMDEMRAGRLDAAAGVVALFFQCSDILSDLVVAARDGGAVDGVLRDRMIAELHALCDKPQPAPEGEIDFQPLSIALDLPGQTDGARDTPAPAGGGTGRTRAVEVRFTPEPGLYLSGNEPLFLIRALRSLGKADVTADIAPLPDLDDTDAATSILSWRIRLETDADDRAIEEVFEFAERLCRLEIHTISGAEAEHPACRDEAAAPGAAPSTAAGARNDAPGATTGTSPTAPSPAAVEPAPDPPARQAGPGATVRVDLDRIDRLVNLVGELVINQSMLAQSVAALHLRGKPKIAAGLDEFQQLTRDIQDSVMMIRAQPVKSLFQRMARIVREASGAVGKSVRLRTEGEGTEIDKTVIERLADPLTHMIRNAVDHGLETTEARRAAGKPAEGRVTLAAFHRSGRVVIEVADDGGGIDRAKVRATAVARGLVGADDSLSDGEIDNLLFMPGFSTAGEVSNLSGRGVGMDVVKSAITALGGRIAIQSSPGEGTRISISLPLTLAVLDGMVVRVHGETLIVPISAISETLLIAQGEARALGPCSQVVRVRDSFVPLIDLGAELGYAGPREDYSGAIALLIAQEDGSRAALVVDGIEDQRQVVIKGLQDSYGHVPGVAAATILGDGQIALILDPAGLLANATGISRPGRLAAAE